MQKYLVPLLKKSAYVLAACIILIALLVAASRYYVSALDTHKPDIEKWASNLLQTPVDIKQVRISWYQYQPEISLNQVTVLGKDNHQPILQVEKVRVFFSLPQSIWQRKLIPSAVMISGTDLNIQQAATGEITLQGFPAFGGFNDQPFKNETKITDVLAWLATQPHIILQHIDLRYTGINQTPRNLTIDQASLDNVGDQHVLFGKGILHQKMPIELTGELKWIGNPADPAQIRAKGYLYAVGMSLPQWLNAYVWHGWKINDGVMTAKVWGSWTKGRFSKIQSTFKIYNLALYSLTDKSTHKINRLSGHVGWRYLKNSHQAVAGDDILIDLPGHLWPITNFYVDLGPQATANVGYVNIGDIQSFLFSSPPLLSNDVRKVLDALQLQGGLQNTKLAFANLLTDGLPISIQTTFDNLDLAPWKSYPGVKHFSGLLKWANNQGTFALQSKALEISYQSIFANPIKLDMLTGDLQLARDPQNGWQVKGQALHAENADLSLDANGVLTMPANAVAQMDLSATYAVARVDHIATYLPTKIFDPELTTWLRQAFLAGELQSGKAIIRGPLNEFPFDKGNGEFTVSGTVNKIDLQFAPDWPLLKNLHGQLIFSGRKMLVDLDRGQILDIPFTAVHAEIPYLGDQQPQFLNVQTSPIEADFSQGLRFVHASPMEKTIGKMFAGMEMTGPMTLKLGLVVPLKNPDMTEVKGTIQLDNAELNLIPWELVIKKMNGEVTFTDKSTDATSISAQLFNKPLQLSLKTMNKSKKLSIVQATVATNLSIADLETWLKMPFSRVAQGSMDTVSQLDLSLDAPIEMHLSTNLVGVSLTLPDQYSKKAEESRDFTADIIVQDQQPLKLKINYANVLNTAMILTRKNKQFSLSGIDLRLGSGEASWPASGGMYISGNIDQLDWDKIKSYAAQSGSTAMTDMNLPLRNIDITTKLLNVLGQRLNNVRLQVSPMSRNWDVAITSQDVVGRLTVPVNFNKNALLNANFQRINLRTSTDDKTNMVIDVKSLPSITFAANNVNYNGMQLGKVTFNSVPTSNGLAIRAITMTTSKIDLRATGDWTQKNNRYMTRLQGVAKSSNVSDFMTSLGYDAKNFVSTDGKFAFDLSWANTPFAPALASMNGSASMELGRGRIVDLGDSSGAKMDLGRMLNIFSLQTIPRRLSFDFSDLFQKGYSFDTLKGDFKFDGGDIYTNNTRFDGPVAKVSINGRIGLDEKDYDLTLSVTPDVTSSIPVAAALLTLQPAVGIAAWAVNKVISPEVSKAITYYYTVRGPWSNPSWNSVSTAGKR